MDTTLEALQQYLQSLPLSEEQICQAQTLLAGADQRWQALQFNVERAELQKRSLNAFLNQTTKDLEETLKQLTEEYHKSEQVLEQSPAMVLITDQQGNIEYANPRFTEVTGYVFDEVKGRHTRLLKSGAHPPETYVELWKTVTSGRVWKSEWCNRKKNGDLYWELAAFAPILDGEGKITRFLKISEDITERRKAEEQLREQTVALRKAKARYRSLVENLPVIMFQNGLDEAGKDLYINPQVEKMLGYPYEQWLQDPSLWNRMIHPDDFERVLAVVTDTRTHGYSSGEYRMVTSDGRTVWVQNESILLRDEEDQPQVIQGFLLDVTARKQAEEALAIARDEALEASRFKSQLLSRVSHELRTPLNGVLGYAELLHTNAFGVLNQEQKEAAALIIESAHYLTNMVNELLDEAQIEAGTIVLDNAFFSPAELLDNVSTILSVLASQKGLLFHAECSPDVPDSLYGDANRLQQIIINLAGNAVKFTHEGEVRVRLFCPDPAHWAIQISDTGVGIPQEAQEYIFEPFRQVDNNITRDNRGSGLGLSITKHLVEKMGGQITLESQVGQGSTFTIFLLIPANLGESIK